MRVPAFVAVPADEPGEDSGSPIVGWITGNTYYHYDEHSLLIEALVRVKT